MKNILFLYIIFIKGVDNRLYLTKFSGDKMAEIKTNVMRILDKEKINYTSHEYPHGKEAVDGESVARLLGQDENMVFKTLVTKGASGSYYVFVVPVSSELDLKKCAKSVKEKSVEMIPVKDITKITGYVRGGCSPVGMKKHFVTTYHKTALEIPKIIVSAGKIGYQIDLAPNDLIALTQGQCADIVKESK